MGDQVTDRTLLDQIQRLMAEEARIDGHGTRWEIDRGRLSSLNAALDQAWDLLRQRRALREFGRDPSEAHVRPAETVERYSG